MSVFRSCSLSHWWERVGVRAFVPDESPSPPPSPARGRGSQASVLAISIFITSELPPAMRRTRESTYMREIGISAM